MTEFVHRPAPLVAADAEVAEAQGPNPLITIHALLHGRYILTAILVVLGLALGTVVGYRVQPPKYQSAGLIRVRPNLPKILYESEQSSVMPMFDAFVDSQCSLILSQRVLNLAMQNPDWQALGRGLSPDAVAEFVDSLDVLHPKASELIKVSFEDKDPKASVVAVRATIEAYLKLYGENDLDSAAQRIQLLEDRRTALTNELKGVKDRIQTVATEYGTTSLERLYEFKVAELNKTEARLKEIELAIAEASGTAKQIATTRPAVTPEMVAAVVPQMRALLEQKQTLTRQLKGNSRRLGEKHSLVVEGRTLIQDVDRDIDTLLKSYTAEDLERLAGGGRNPVEGMSLEHLKANAQSVHALYDREKSAAIELGRKSLLIQNLEAEAESVTSRLAETKSRIEQLNVEASVSGRITVISYGDKPLAPFVDKRKAFAAVGGLGCAGVGVGLMLLIGLLDGRVKRVADAQAQSLACNRLLGVLPSLPTDLTDPEQVAITAHAVHQIRTLLQMMPTANGAPTFSVTSPSPQAGKTSLTIALGLSFAVSGSRTLLIDCDIIGGGLSSAMKNATRRKIGQVLVREGLLDKQQVKQVLRHMQGKDFHFGEAAVSLGLLSKPDVDDALALQQQPAPGLREAFSGERIEGCIVATDVPHLFLLPLGSAAQQHVGQLSVAGLRSLISVAQKHFDVILIDTGPVLGSLEAQIVGTAADAVVMVVPRGEQRSLIQRSITQLKATGACLAGLVFNRARHEDIVSSGFSSSMSLRSVPVSGKSRPTLLPTSSIRFGPVGSAVAASTELMPISQTK